MLVVTVACAGSVGPSLLSPSVPNAERPAARPSKASRNPCASYGANFVRIEGTGTCMKVGGAVREPSRRIHHRVCL